MLSKQNKFFLVIAFQLFIIISLIIFKYSILTGGVEIFLKIAPVDPRDLLRGDYVTFRYADISQLNFYDQNFIVGDTVYVLLKKGDKYWRVSGYPTENKPKEENSIFIKGKISSVNKNSINVRYGIEEYFIAEGTGRTFNFAGKEAVAKVSVDKDGNAVLKQLYIDGEVWP